MPQILTLKSEIIESAILKNGILGRSDRRRFWNRSLLYKWTILHLNKVPTHLGMPQLDLSQAFASQEDPRWISSVAVADAFFPNSRTASEGQKRVRPPVLSRSTWANIVFVACACLGGVFCAFYFFNAADLLKAASSWPREFLYPEPVMVGSNHDASGEATDPEDTAASDDPSNENATGPFNGNLWPSTLNQSAVTFANLSSNPSGAVNPPSVPGIPDLPGFSGGPGVPGIPGIPDLPGGSFSLVGSVLNRLNGLTRGADMLFQLFYKRATTMVPAKIRRSTDRTLNFATARVSNLTQRVTGQVTGPIQQSQATLKGSAPRLANRAAHSVQQAVTSVSAQNQLAAIQAVRSQRQAAMAARAMPVSAGGAVHGLIGGRR